MSEKKGLFGRVALLHLAVLLLWFVLPLLSSCQLFKPKKEQIIEIDLAGAPLPEPPPVDEQPETPEEDPEPDQGLPQPTAQPTVRPTATPTVKPTATPQPEARPTATPRPTATARPTATPRPTSTPRRLPTPTPTWKAVSREELMERIRNQQQNRPRATPNRMNSTNIEQALGQGLNQGGGGSVLGPGSGSGRGNLSGVAGDLKQRLYSAWRQPQNLSGRTVVAEVVVARDGTIRSARIRNASGISTLDNSVRQALSSVSKVRAFPSNFSEAEHRFVIDFNITP